MSEPSEALQRAIYQALAANTDAGAAVFDAVGPGDPFPRITLGEVQVLDDSSDCRVGFECFADVHVWSRAVGSIEAKRIGGQVHDLLAGADLEVEGFHLVQCDFRDARYFRDPDGLTTHGVLTFQVVADRDD